MRKNILSYLISAISGCTLTLAFAPFRIDTIAIISLAVFFYIFNKSNKLSTAMLSGLFFGIGYFTTSMYWTYISISIFTLSTLAGLAALIALVILMLILHTIPFSIFAYFSIKKNNNIAKVFLFASLWTIFELCRSTTLWGGFPWVGIGYSQTESPLIGYSAIGGSYLVTYIVAFIAAMLAVYIPNYKNKKNILTIIILIALTYIGGHLIQAYYKNDLINNTEKPINVALVQGNYSQQEKYDRNKYFEMLDFYKKINENNKDSLIILPESAIPNYRKYILNYLSELQSIAEKNNNAMIISSYGSDNNDNVYNSSSMIGEGSGIYNKHHLVPFGEYFPIKFFGYIDSVGLSSLSPGDEIQPLMMAYNTPLANFICYEIAYPQQVRKQLQDAKFISVVSDDSWFGDSIARDQQLQITQVRAIELNKYIVATTNDGMTAVIKPNGDIQSTIPKDKQLILKDKIYPNTSKTLWDKLGMIIVWSLICFSVLFGFICRFYKTK